MTEAEMVPVQLPMWVIEQIRTDMKLTSGTWSVIEECVERSVAQADQVLPCDVKLPPGTVFAKGSKLSTLLLAMKQRENGSALNTSFQ
jgi:hypothetical protein